jgi:signal transduction histidine kinase
VSLRAHEDAGVLRIDVDDDGPGIAPADRAAVLERGRRLDERMPGSGLGLAIVDELARAHGGSIELDEAPSPLGGLRASLRLPAGVG